MHTTLPSVSNPTLYFFTAGVTTLLPLLFLWALKATPREGPSRHLRNHTKELSRAWTLLALFYWFRLALEQLVPGISNPSYTPANLATWVTLFHLGAIAVSVATNIYLRRSIVELEIVYLPVESSYAPIFRGATSATILGSRLVRLFTDSIAILTSLLISATSLVLPHVLSIQFSWIFPFTAYSSQAVVSLALFVRLSAAYSKFRKGALPAWPSFAYGLFQFLSPLPHFLPRFALFEFFFDLAKLAFGLSVFGWINYSASRSAKQGEAYQPLDPAIAAEMHREMDAIEKLATRTREQAKLYRIGQLGFSLLTILGLLGLISLPYGWSLSALEQVGAPTLVLMATRFAWVAAAILITQITVYVVRRRFNYAIPWRKHSLGALAENIRVGTRGPTTSEAWTHLTLEPATSGSDSNGPDMRSRVQVILLHGLFSSGERCWGLLPAILLDSGLVSQVHLISYRHGLFSGTRQAYQLTDELKDILATRIRGTRLETVIFAHSLGALLAMRALSALARDRALMKKLRHFVAVAPPLAGSAYVWLCWPWSWSRLLAPGRRFVVETLESFAEAFPSPGAVVGEDKALCTCSLLYGTRDNVIGPLVKLFSIPGRKVAVPSWHSTSSVLDPRSDHARRFLEELAPMTRSEFLMAVLASNLKGKRSADLALVFKLAESEDIASALSIWELRSDWNEAVIVGMSRVDQEKDLESVLSEHFSQTPGAGGADWKKYWTSINTTFSACYRGRNLALAEWPGRRSLYLFSNGEAGFAMIMDNELGSIG